jgi:Kef-type K+ transport system membrane component KefB
MPGGIQLLLKCAAVWAGAMAGGGVMRRLGQSAVMGELLAGVVLARFVPWGGDPALKILAKAGMLAFMFYTGLEMELERVRRMGRASLFASVLGIAAPFAAGYWLGSVCPSDLVPAGVSRLTFALFMGTAVSISAIPVIARILMDLGLFKSDLGAVIVSAAVVDDTVGWVLLALISGAATGGRLLGSFEVFLVFAAGAALSLIPAARAKRETAGRLIQSTIAPFFFAFAGLNVDLSAVGSWGVVLAFLAAACASKLAGCGLGALMGGMGPWGALAVGVGMNARGAMELVVAMTGLSLGILNRGSYSIVVLIALITSLMTPPLLRRVAPRALAE